MFFNLNRKVLKMKFTQQNVKINQIIDGFSGQNLLDVNATIVGALDKCETYIYARAIEKVLNKEVLNRKDLKVLDKIDAITYEMHGMCLKDSNVTKARLKACKKYGVQFVDRDGLVEHMHLLQGARYERDEKAEFYKLIGDFFVEKLGEVAPRKLSEILRKADTKEYLNLADLSFLSDMEFVASEELDWTIVNEDLKIAINRSCKKLGIYFSNLQKTIAN